MKIRIEHIEDDENENEFQWQNFNANGMKNNRSQGGTIRIFYKDKDYKYIHYHI